MLNTGDVRNQIEEYNIIDPILPFPGDVELIDPTTGVYEPNLDLFVINSLEDNNKKNMYNEFLEKYFYKPIHADKLGSANRRVFYPVLLTSSDSDENGRHLCFAYYLTVASLFEDKKYCRQLLEEIRDKKDYNPMTLIDKNIEYYEEHIKGLADFKRKRYYSKYRDICIERIIKATTIRVNGETIKSMSQVDDEFKRLLCEKYDEDLEEIISDNLNIILDILKNIKREMSLETEREHSDYQDQMRKDLLACFQYDKFVLCYMKKIVDYQKRLIKRNGEISNSFNEVMNFFNILDNCKGVKYNPSIKVYDPKRRKFDHYNVNDLRIEYNNIKKKYVKQEEGQEISIETAKRLGLIRNIDKLKKYQEFQKSQKFSEEDDKAINMNWEILRPGERITDVRGYNGAKPKVRGNKSIKDNSEEIEYKEFIFHQTNPTVNIYGKDKFDGYVGYVYNNGLVVFEKYQQYGESSNATYIMDIFNFKELCKLTKTEIMEQIKNDDQNIRRLYHTANWGERIISLIKSVEETDETLMAVDQLSVDKTRK